MRRLIEITHVSLGGAIGPTLEWAMPYLDEEHASYATDLLFGADALLLGRKTYEGLSAAYPAMDPSPFVDRMNAIPKYVASRTLKELAWNSTVIEGDVADFVAKLKQQPGGHLVKYGNGPLDACLMEHHLVDEFHLLLTPVAAGGGQHMFESLTSAPALHLADVTALGNGVVVLRYTPIR
jgi:dihydrofolate reductase